MKKLIHKTYKSNYESIKQYGLKINQEESGRFGYGVYFMEEDEFGDYGDGLKVICEVDKEYLYEMELEELKEEYPHLYYDEEGEVEIQNKVESMGYKGVIIPYLRGDKEIVIYDEDIIKIKSISER